MELSNYTVRDFTALLGSDAPAPGGGSAAALEGALGAALTAMVCALTVGRKKYAAFEEEARAALARANALQEAFLRAMQRDTEAFDAFGAAMALPRATPEEKASRDRAMQEALGACIASPLEMMRLAADMLLLADGLRGKYNTNAASDFAVGALSLCAAVHGAWLNVLINLNSQHVRDERAFAEGQALLARCEALSEEIYRETLAQLS